MPETPTTNTLCNGDNLEILREHVATNSIDLIYLDPPFNSQRDYNLLFKDVSGKPSESQAAAFVDTWNWNETTQASYEETVKAASEQTSTMLQSFRRLLGTSSLMSYLVMMTARIVELHRVLKPTGSLYLHCDPAASHYLKIMLDSVFGNDMFRSEIIWRRTNAHNKTVTQYGPIHDVILFYSKSDTFTFHPGTRPYSKAYIEDRFKYSDERGRYQTNYLTGPGTRNGESGIEWRGFNPTRAGRHWAIPQSLRPFLPNGGSGMSSHQQLEALYAQSLIVFPKKEGGQPMYKQYMGNGVPYQDVWAYQPNTKGVLFGTDESIDQDVKWLEDEAEKLGFETQKPVGLLHRILRTSSNEGDIVLDPFCGCGTTVIAAENLKRRWIGIDISILALALQERRMKEIFPGIAYSTIGIPKDLAGAKHLAQVDRYKFQWWAVFELGGRPVGAVSGSKAGKKGADQGIDGIVPFFDDVSGVAKRAIVQVKSGNVGAADIRELIGTVQREEAEIGIFLTLAAPTAPMLKEATAAGFYRSETWGKDYPKIQIITVADLLANRRARIPQQRSAFKTAQKAKPGEQLFLHDTE